MLRIKYNKESSLISSREMYKKKNEFKERHEYFILHISERTKRHNRKMGLQIDFFSIPINLFILLYIT